MISVFTFFFYFCAKTLVFLRLRHSCDITEVVPVSFLLRLVENFFQFLFLREISCLKGHVDFSCILSLNLGVPINL